MPSAAYRKKPVTIKGACIAALLLTSASIARADTSSANTEVQVAVRSGGSTTAVAPAADSARQENPTAIGDLIVLFQRQADELAAQRELLESQARQIAALSEEVQTLRSGPAMVTRDEAKSTIAAHERQLESQRQQIATLVNELDLLREPPPIEEDSMLETADNTVTVAEIDPDSDEMPAIETSKDLEDQVRAQTTGSEVAQAQADDPTRALLADFTGAWRLPGTSAALRIGGYVKTAAVYNNDALAINDRFIVGSIPVGVAKESTDEAQSSVTADQSRINFDLRQPTEYGIMRAFIEGDFAGKNETFRLRHAFGQWARVVTGKTWSTFMDPDASPEEIDFEGLNGRINVRQAQLRFMPRFGEQYELQLALEDPDPRIQNGSGVTRKPDLIVAGRIDLYNLHTKLSLLGREIRGQTGLSESAASNGSEVRTESEVRTKYAWGVSLSGNIATPYFDDRDKLLFQINTGNGIGRYVNDLSSIGNYDGIFNEESKLELFYITAGYVSWQHWWGINQLRSNFTFGAVEVDNPDFVESDAYKRTLRFSANLLWSPIPRIDLGGEYLWGQRENQDNEEGTATQFQIMARYRF
ncbi:MAG: DcaP family trimeric outer membrane transporter [Halioglobus sp.]|nr:DcaP family trimeric outer membrane transporter [Halioglobus sp.]